MPSDKLFRLSLYLTLMLACICVGYAEHDLLPEMPFITAVVVCVLAILYRLESRIQMFSIPDANRLGLIVGLLSLVWAVFRIIEVSQRKDKGESQVQLVLIALFGPLLLMLIPAKLARREQHVGDYWGLQGMGLVAVCLAGAIEDDAVCSTLIALYAIAAVWSLGLFHLHRAAGGVAPIPNRPATPVAGIVASHQPWRGVQQTLGLIVPGVAIAVPLYLVTPHSPGEKLNFGEPRVEIGYAASQMLDLNQTGNLKGNPAPAFEVAIEAKMGLIPEFRDGQLWRGRVLQTYTRGTWEPSDIPLPGVDGAPRNHLNWSPPRLGVGQCALTFSVPSSLPGQFLAEPITWAVDQPVPVASLTASGPQPWLWGGDGTFLWSGRISRAETHHYIQMWQPKAEPDLSPEFHIVDADPTAKIRLLTQNPVRKVKAYADELVDRLIHERMLPADCRDQGLPRRQFHDQIAKVFSHHLSTSPEFRYTTQLRRNRKDLDPIEEFLFHSRAGHCERFASALALLLRSQGIPTVLVLGFKGQEPTLDPQRYVVKQEHAHAWVDALILEYEPAGADGQQRPISRWRTLDPTPGGEASEDDPSGGWAADARTWAQTVVKETLLKGTVEDAQSRLSLFARGLLRWEILAVLCVLLAVLIQRRRRVKVVPARQESPMLGRLLAVLGTHGLAPRPGETLHEFARRLASKLTANPRTAGVAEVTSVYVDAYYEARFGGRELSPERLEMLDTELRALDRSLNAANLRGET